MTENPSSRGVGEASMKYMEKNIYIVPECLVVELETIQMIAASFDVNAGSKDGVDAMGANYRRGEWGNLWSDNQ